MGPCRVQAVGIMKAGPLFQLWKEYQKRLRYPVNLMQHAQKASYGNTQEESELILNHLKPNEVLIALDERGESLDTQKFYELLKGIYLTHKTPCFALGGADGHHACLRQQSSYVISLGAFTWPHMLARVMLIEQLYRIQQIHRGHPYHRL